MSIVMPKGFRFHPKEDELVNYYLYSKVNGEESVSPPPYLKFPEVDIYGEEPWEIWERFERQDEESLYFFAIPKKLNPKGKRIDRRTNTRLGTWSEGERSRTVEDENGNSIGTKRKFRYENARSLHHAAWQLEEYSSNFSPHWVICHLRKNKRSPESKKAKDDLPRLIGKKRNNKDDPSTSTEVNHIMPNSKRSRKVDNQVVENKEDLPQSSTNTNDQQFSMPSINNSEHGLHHIFTTTGSTIHNEQQFYNGKILHYPADLGNVMPVSDAKVVDSLYTPCYNCCSDLQQSSTNSCTHQHSDITSNSDFIAHDDGANINPINDANGDDTSLWQDLWNYLLAEGVDSCP